MAIKTTGGGPVTATINTPFVGDQQTAKVLPRSRAKGGGPVDPPTGTTDVALQNVVTDDFYSSAGGDGALRGVAPDDGGNVTSADELGGGMVPLLD